ncbi:MAG TPA: DNA topoisomerase IB [Chitinophagaceae bacterium]|jgi:DNA topoisomerase-1|nr:DNA topoisomerase IB [Chitinophagaceae bacterium]
MGASPIKKSRLKELGADPVATAKAARLVYINGTEEGISRVPSGKGFIYKYKDRTVKNKAQLKRIQLLVLPPAWTEVWICVLDNGHLQATGLDIKKRKQYRYHQLWNEIRGKTKFYRLLELGKVLPIIRKRVQKDLALPGLPKNKVLAAVITLMEKTGIRIGNEVYEKLYGSFGLTTLKDKHAEIKGGEVKFTFRGKKGVEHCVTLKNKKLSKIVNQCRDIPGQELFQYRDEEGKRQSIESGMVNDYIKEIAEGEFTAKDLRTWCGTVTALNALTEAGAFETETEGKKKVIEVLDKVAEQLGNSRTVCKKYYVHPSLLDLYENGRLEPWLVKKGSGTKQVKGLQAEEKILMNILKKV